jgi:hypothetical protein
MGQLFYGVSPAIRIDDWALRHLQTVILTKLRRDESFSFSWDGEAGIEGDAGDPGAAPGTIWVSRASSLYFQFDGDRSGPLNKRWLVALAEAANGSGGLRLLPEPK